MDNQTDIYLKRIDALEKQNKEQEKKLDGAIQVLRQLIPSLFNYETQRRIFELHCNHLKGHQNSTDEYYDSFCSDGGLYATTRQGDSNQERIVELEKIVKDLMKENTKEEK